MKVLGWGNGLGKRREESGPGKRGSKDKDWGRGGRK